MADRMGLDGTMLHYLAVRKALVRVNRPVHSKITLPYSLTWQTDCCTPRRMAFKALLNAKAACSSFLCTCCLNNCQNGLLLKHSYCTVDYRSTMCVGTSMIRRRSIKSSLPFSLPLHPSRDKLFQALYLFSVLQATESWAGAWERGCLPVVWYESVSNVSPSGMVWKCQ